VSTQTETCVLKAQNAQVSLASLADCFKVIWRELK
jgi:hypothetical protein